MSCIFIAANMFCVNVVTDCVVEVSEDKWMGLKVEWIVFWMKSSLFCDENQYSPEVTDCFSVELLTFWTDIYRLLIFWTFIHRFPKKKFGGNTASAEHSLPIFEDIDNSLLPVYGNIIFSILPHFYFYFYRGVGGRVVQCSAHDLKVVSLILAHGSFQVRGSTLVN